MYLLKKHFEEHRRNTRHKLCLLGAFNLFRKNTQTHKIVQSVEDKCARFKKGLSQMIGEIGMHIDRDNHGLGWLEWALRKWGLSWSGLDRRKALRLLSGF